MPEAEPLFIVFHLHWLGDPKGLAYPLPVPPGMDARTYRDALLANDAAMLRAIVAGAWAGTDRAGAPWFTDENLIIDRANLERWSGQQHPDQWAELRTLPEWGDYSAEEVERRFGPN